MSETQDPHSQTDREWFLLLGQRYQGPFGFTEICEKLAHSTLSPITLTWTEGMSDWLPLNQIETFKALTKDMPAVNNPDMYDESGSQPDEEEDAFSIEAIDPKLAESFATALTEATQPEPVPKPKIEPKNFVNNDIIWAELINSHGDNSQTKRVELIVDPVQIKRHVPAWKDALLAIVVVATVGGAAYSVAKFRSEVISPLADVSREENRELQAAAAEALKSETPAAAIALSKADPFLPFFYVATNLQEGARIDVQIDGVPETLVGKFNVSVRATATVKNHLVRTPLFRDTDGQLFPKGEYRVTATCASCASTDKAPLIAQKTYFLGGAKNAEYDQRLKTYHENLVQQAQTEIGEIKQVAETVQSQLDESATTFNKVIAALNRNNKIKWPGKTWSEFHTSWTHLQEQIDSIMLRWTPDALEVGYFHGALYSELKKAADGVKQYHQAQNDYLTSATSDESAEQKLSTTVESLRASIKSLREKIANVEQLPTLANGMPQRIKLD